MPVNNLARGVVLTLSAEPLELPAGPLRFLLRLRQMAGHARRLTTFTKSLATLFGCCPNTIRNWRNVLVDEGYIHWLTDSRTGQTTILIRERVEPPRRRMQLERERREAEKPTPLPWQRRNQEAPVPRPWWKTPIRTMFWRRGAQKDAPIKPNTNSGAVQTYPRYPHNSHPTASEHRRWTSSPPTLSTNRFATPGPTTPG